MKATITPSGLAVWLLMTACTTPVDRSGFPASEAIPIAQPAMTAWQQGDMSAAIHLFAQADWSTLPLFPTTSTLSLSEEEFQALSNAEREACSREMMSQLDIFKKLAAAVAQAGRDAAAKGDTANARTYFTSLKRCGMALDQPGCLRLRVLQLVGREREKLADAELGKVGP
jgi:hypothetical protein